MADELIPDDKMMPVEAVKVAFVGSGTGDGGSTPTTGIVVTPEGQPNILFQAVGPLTAIVIRFVNLYLTTLVGLMTAAGTTSLIPFSDFANLVVTCSKLALAGAAFGVIKDAATIFSGLEKKHPLPTGNV